MLMHRRGRGSTTPALNYGSAWHNAMAASYSAPEMSRADLIEHVRMAVAEGWKLTSNPDDYRTFERVMVEYERYLDHWGFLPWDEPAQTIGWPDAPMVEIGVELQIPGARHPYAGKLDRIVQQAGQYLIEDHKTTSSLRSDYFTQWEIDNQMIGYSVLAGLVTGLQVSGVRINLHVVRKSDSVFERRTIHFSPKRQQDWMHKYESWLERIEGDVILHRQARANAFPENFNACSRKFGMCQYIGVCTLDPERRKYALEQDFDIEEWNPLAAEEGADA